MGTSWTVLLCAFLLTVLVMPARAEGLKLSRKARPRLALTLEEIVHLQSLPDEVEKIRRGAESHLSKTRTVSYPNYYVALPEPADPLRHPNDPEWPYWTGVCGEIGSYLRATSLAYRVTGEERFFDACRKLLLALSRWQHWSDPDYSTQPCLDTYSLCTGVGIAYDYLYDDLSPEDRKAIRKAMVEKGILLSYRAGQDPRSYYYNPKDWPNGFAMVTTGLGVAALAVFDEEPEAPGWAEQAIEKARLYFDQEGGKDGGLVEGMSYGTAAVDPLMTLVIALQKSVGVDLFRHPFLSQVLYLPLYFLAPGGRTAVAFCDAGSVDGCPETLAGTLQALAAVHRNGLASWLLDRLGQHDWQSRNVKPVAPARLTASRAFYSVGWAALRSGWESDDVLLAFKSGPFRSHSHPDQNSFVVAAAGEWLATDPGYQRYDMKYPNETDQDKIHKEHLYSYGTVGHNTILVDGQGQVEKDGKLVDFFSSPLFDYVAGDAAAPYNGLLRRFTREVVFIKPDYFVMVDDIETDGQARKVEWLLHTAPRGKLSVNGQELANGQSASARTLEITREKGHLLAQVLWPEEPQATHILPDRAWETYGHHLAVEHAPAPASRFAFLLQAGPVSKPLQPLKAQAYPTEGGGVVIVIDRKGSQENLLFGGVKGEGVELQGRCGMVREIRGQPVSFVLIDGTIIKHNNQTLLQATRKVFASAQKNGRRLSAHVQAAVPCTIGFYYPEVPQAVRLNRRPLDKSHWMYDAHSGTLRLEIPAGTHTIRVE